MSFSCATVLHRSTSLRACCLNASPIRGSFSGSFFATSLNFSIAIGS